jgi:hypothetical protein
METEAMTKHPKSFLTRDATHNLRDRATNVGLRINEAGELLGEPNKTAIEDQCQCGLCLAWPEISDLLLNLIDSYNIELDRRDEAIELFSAELGGVLARSQVHKH